MSRRGNRKEDGDRRHPLYARVLRLDHLRPDNLLCFLLFEGSIALAVMLSLAEVVTWWSVLVLPLVIAGLVKIVDLVVAVLFRTERAPFKVRGVARVEELSDGTMQASPAEPPGAN